MLDSERGLRSPRAVGSRPPHTHRCTMKSKTENKCEAALACARMEQAKLLQIKHKTWVLAGSSVGESIVPIRQGCGFDPG